MFSRSFKETNKFKLSKKSKRDYLYGINYHLNNSDQLIYKDLINRSDDSSAVFTYLIVNERLLNSRQLVLSDNCEPFLANYIKKHLDMLTSLYDYHNENDVSKSFISLPYPVAKLYSKQLLPVIPDKTNDTDDNYVGDNDNNDDIYDYNIFIPPLRTSLNVSSSTSINLVNLVSCISPEKNHAQTMKFTMSLPIVSNKIHFPV